MKKYVQITAGRGPIECARVVTLVAKELLKAIPSIELVDCEPHNLAEDCFMSMTFMTQEDLSASLINEWQGTIQWHSTKNPYRPHHKRCNWFVGISFFDKEELPKIRDIDIIYETCHAGGKGGQNVNKVETAVRAIHIPTGLSVRCSDERSQKQNKILAYNRLIIRLHRMNEQIIVMSHNQQWKKHDTLMRGNPIRKFSGPL